MVVKSGYTPLIWRTMKVVFIPKVGKADYGLAKAYRPITLSNFMLKGLERIMQWMIREKFVHGPLQHQHAYTTGLSAETALSEFANLIEKNVTRGRKLLAVSLDCSGAFDRIKFDSAHKAMEEMGLPMSIIKWYDQLLRNRKVVAEIQGVTQVIKPGRGSPQGGVLSPMVWNIIMNTLLSRFGKTEAVKVIGYADDILLLVEGHVTHVMGDIMQKKLEEVIRWGDLHGLVFNPLKTTVVMFDRARKFKSEPEIRMRGKILTYSENLKYLGVTFSKRRTWTHHITSRINVCKFLLNKTKAVVGREWGLTPDRLLWIYNTIIRPRISYGCVVWAHETNVTNERNLDRLQRLSLSRIARCPRSIPMRALEVIMGITPLTLHLQEMAVQSMARIRKWLKPSNWDGVDSRGKTAGHRALSNAILKSIPEGSLPTDQILKYKNWRRNDPQEGDPLESLNIFTDGSRLNERTGYGWLVTLNDELLAEGMSFMGDATVFNAELAAIYAGLKWLLDMRGKLSRYGRGKRRVVIHSDSQSAINAIFAPHITSEWVQKVAEVLDQTKIFYNVEIKWIKAHVGHVGNEYADMMAKRGASSDVRGPTPTKAIPRVVLKQKIREHFNFKWQQMWVDYKGADHAKLMLPRVDRLRKKEVFQMTSDSIKKVVQFTTGHGPFGGHLEHWTEANPRCKLCRKGIEMPWHWHMECEGIQFGRSKITVKSIL